MLTRADVEGKRRWNSPTCRRHRLSFVLFLDVRFSALVSLRAHQAERVALQRISRGSPEALQRLSRGSPLALLAPAVSCVTGRRVTAHTSWSLISFESTFVLLLIIPPPALFVCSLLVAHFLLLYSSNLHIFARPPDVCLSSTAEQSMAESAAKSEIIERKSTC